VSIKVNRIFSRKRNTAGIPADVMIPALLLDILVLIFGCVTFGFPWMPTVVVCLAIDVAWAILVARGVWRFLGTFHHPSRYYRANIRYKPFLQFLQDYDDRPQKAKQAKRKRRR
jgi:fatty acid desaturase